VLRIHFTADDLQRVRVARRPDPMWELMSSVCRVQTRQGPLDFGHWRRGAHARLRADRAVYDALALLRTLIPPIGYIPDFLTPPPSGPELGAGLDRLRATPPALVARDLARLAAERRGGGTATYSAFTGRSSGEGLAAVAGALETYHRGVIAPHWAQVRGAVTKDVAIRTRGLLEGGTQALLHGLRPFATWRAPVLEVDYPVDRDLRLAGRGLLLVPSYFCWRRPIALADPELPPVLVYPVVRDPLSDAAGTGEEGLVRLLGRTRAAVLAEVARTEAARTTSEIAESVGVSLPSASYQITVLRESGLLASRRAGKYVLHTPTPLGLALLSSAPDPPSTPRDDRDTREARAAREDGADRDTHDARDARENEPP
jgi:DNA-binding transcriptional ArsR family regulator